MFKLYRKCCKTLQVFFCYVYKNIPHKNKNSNKINANTYIVYLCIGTNI